MDSQGARIDSRGVLLQEHILPPLAVGGVGVRAKVIGSGLTIVAVHLPANFLPNRVSMRAGTRDAVETVPRLGDQC